MKVYEIAEKLGFELLVDGENKNREVGSLYACDLLSWVISKAKDEHLWFTVMGNVNTIAVASLTDVCAVVLTDNSALDEDAKKKAEQNEIVIYRTSTDTANIIIKTNELMK